MRLLLEFKIFDLCLILWVYFYDQISQNLVEYNIQITDLIDGLSNESRVDLISHRLNIKKKSSWNFFKVKLRFLPIIGLFLNLSN